MLLLEGAPFSVEVLDVVEPGDAVGDPDVGGFEAILERGDKPVRALLLFTCAPVPTDTATRERMRTQSQQWLQPMRDSP